MLFRSRRIELAEPDLIDRHFTTVHLIEYEGDRCQATEIDGWIRRGEITKRDRERLKNELPMRREAPSLDVTSTQHVRVEWTTDRTIVAKNNPR